jgi:uncharacterized protein
MVPSVPPPSAPAVAPIDGVRTGRHGLPPFQWWAPFLAMLITLVVALIGLVLIEIGVEAAGTTIDADDPPPGVTVGATLVQDLALIASALLLASSVARPTPGMFGLRATRLWSAVGWTALCFGAFYVFLIAWTLALGVEDSDDLAEKLGAKDSAAGLVVVTALVTVVAPIAEELFFRGFTFPALWRRFGLWPAVVVTGIIFGGIHAGGSPVEFLVPLAFFGSILCLLYRQTGSLLPCMAVHSINNSIALAVTLKWEWWEGVALVVGAPCLVLALVTPLARRATLPIPRPAT